MAEDNLRDLLDLMTSLGHLFTEGREPRLELMFCSCNACMPVSNFCNLTSCNLSVEALELEMFELALPQYSARPNEAQQEVGRTCWQKQPQAAATRRSDRPGGGRA